MGHTLINNNNNSIIIIIMYTQQSRETIVAASWHVSAMAMHSDNIKNIRKRSVQLVSFYLVIR